MHVYVARIFVVQSQNQYGEFVAFRQRLFKFAADGRQLEVEEIPVRCLQVCQQGLYGNPFVSTFRRIAVDEEVHHGEEGMAVHILAAAHFADRLVTESQTDAEGAEPLEHAVVVADDVNHLVVSLVKFYSYHRKCLFLRLQR